MQHAVNMGPNLFAHNENVTYVIPCATTHAVTSCTHCVAHAHRQAVCPTYMWHARNCLWMCHLALSKLTASHSSTLNMKIANQNALKRILTAMHNENKADCNENFRICAEEPVAPLYKCKASIGL